MSIATLKINFQQRMVRIHNGWKSLSTNTIVSLATRGAILCSLLAAISILFAWPKLPPVVPLWYSKTWGTERLAHAAWLFILPSSTLTITLVNAYIASFLTNEYLVFSQIISLGSFVINILSLLTLGKIIFLVI